MAVYDDRDFTPPLAQRASVFVSFAGAAVSLSLMAGIGVWGYELIKRDVSGIPVVKAIEGAMRVTPDNPGGELAVHTGLAVNAVPAVGEAAGFGDTLALAPSTPDLAAEDLEVQPFAEADEVVPAGVETAVRTQTALTEDPTLSTPAKPLSADDILALADQIAASTTPMTALADGDDIAPTVALDGQVIAAVERIPASVPGIAVSLRPTLRPAALIQASAPASLVDTATAVNAALEAAVQTSALPVGTKLVQLGAFPSAENAATEWTRLQARFGDFMSSKERVIQEASSGGRTFYRLRASGFGDLSDARRFCAALEAGDADCIPVVVR